MLFRSIFGLGQFLVFLVALLPAGLLAALVVLVLQQFNVPWTVSAPLAAVPAALGLGVEAAAGIRVLGKVFEKFDLSGEPQH